MAGQTFERELTELSREMEFFTESELEKQMGYDRLFWAAGLLVEVIGNGLDAAEKTRAVVPVIDVRIEADSFTVFDNGDGIPAETVKRSMNYHTRVSDKAAYVSPTRGRQGNALKTLWAAPFVVDEDNGGPVTVWAQDVLHTIRFSINQVEGRPLPDHKEDRVPQDHDGSMFIVRWPGLADELTTATQSDFYDFTDWNHDDDDILLSADMRDVGVLVRAFALFNPHAEFRLSRPDRPNRVYAARRPDWPKWGPKNSIPPHWYKPDEFVRLIASFVSADRRAGRNPRTVRAFLGEFRGLRGTQPQKAVCAEAKVEGTLADLFHPDDTADMNAIARLHRAMKYRAENVEPKSLGVIGKKAFVDGLVSLFGCHPASTKYVAAEGYARGVPWVLEVAIGYGPKYDAARVVVAGLNWAPALRLPFEGLADALQAAMIEKNDAVVVAVHLVFPAATATDRSKTRYDLPEEITGKLTDLLEKVSRSSGWRGKKVKANRETRRVEADEHAAGRKGKKDDKAKVKAAAWEVMEEAYRRGSDGAGMATARQVMYPAREMIIALTGIEEPWKDSQYFTQTLLPEYMRENPESTAGWDVIFDDRGHFAEPHTEKSIGIGTLAVREYIGEWSDGRTNGLIEAPRIPHLVPTAGPDNRFKFVLFVEKEGFNELLTRNRIAERFDLAMMSSKGMSSTSARRLIDHLSDRGVTILVLHDFDLYGLRIHHRLRTSNDRYTFRHGRPNVQSIGFRLKDVTELGLTAEKMVYPQKKDPRVSLRECEATEDECAYLVGEKKSEKEWKGNRVELNQPSARVMLEYIERKLTAAGARKVIPAADQLAVSYQLAVRLSALEGTVDYCTRHLNEAVIDVPPDLHERLAAVHGRNPELSWDGALHELAKADPRVQALKYGATEV